MPFALFPQPSPGSSTREVPHADNAPAHLPQLARHNPVPDLISIQFLCPKLPIVLRHVRMFGTAMPETAIHKKNHLLLREDKIWFAEQGLISSPS